MWESTERTDKTEAIEITETETPGTTETEKRDGGHRAHGSQERSNEANGENGEIAMVSGWMPIFRGNFTGTRVAPELGHADESRGHEYLDPRDYRLWHSAALGGSMVSARSALRRG